MGVGRRSSASPARRFAAPLAPDAAAEKIVTQAHWLSNLDGLPDRASPPPPNPAQRLMALARRKTGLEDFGSEPIEEALEQLLSAYREEADLNLFGRLSTRWDNLRLLKNLLILRDRERQDPSILRRAVQQPIFVMGLPRSGTSFLHALLAEDPDSEVLRCWQAIHPYPDHPAAGHGAGPDSVQRQFRLFHWIAPELRSLHPFEARTPQECTELTAHSFQSLRFDTTYEVPSYRRWLSRAGHLAGYRVHKRFLQHLQDERPARWVLKSPDHVFAMDALRAVYPDARIVFAHRDPLKVLPSVARLTQVLRRPFSRRVDPIAVGRQITNDWAVGAQRMMTAHLDQLWPASQVFHVHYKAVTSDPLGTVSSLYDHFGLELTPAFRERLGAYVEVKPDGGYGRNVYRFEDFGLDPGRERDRYRDYMRCFDVEEEFAAA
jgi:hypothetical protein